MTTTTIDNDTIRPAASYIHNSITAYEWEAIISCTILGGNYIVGVLVFLFLLFLLLFDPGKIPNLFVSRTISAILFGHLYVFLGSLFWMRWIDGFE